MYSGSGFEQSELGDICIIKNKNTYHLFHLILPNHDYIAHATSKDGLNWKRVKNALFIGDPGTWDDDMLWTMHVSIDPHNDKQWRMFYTGLSRKENGRIQRIGIAISENLLDWTKVENENYPISIAGPFYEESVTEGRNWVSCRDPFFFHNKDHNLLLVNARVPHGPIIRRGCVGVAKEVAPNNFEWQQPLFYPRMYDDVEVPGLYFIKNRWYLIGNIREDIKVHYWHADEIFGEFEAFYDNVLLPKGNYAARFTEENGKILVWNFFATEESNRASKMLPPPKEVIVIKNGQLRLKSFYGFKKKITHTLTGKELTPISRILKNPTSRAKISGETIHLASKSGYEIFQLNPSAQNFRLKYDIEFNGIGKSGIHFRTDEQANGYFISFDFIKGYVQIRRWGVKEDGKFTDAFTYTVLQSNNFKVKRSGKYSIKLIAYGGYMELSIDKFIVISLVDNFYRYRRLGLFVESADILVSNAKLEFLEGPITENF